ncbi:MAG: flagellar motor switch protein FliN [Alphaproteobacteria bacterium]|nr:flagellar motor switch protein FliN [Alphaproteobacteria bacterium]MDP6515527.1 flagellar motor switch protein FliN [Alphaproteobacteria bacterium]
MAEDEDEDQPAAETIEDASAGSNPDGDDQGVKPESDVAVYDVPVEIWAVLGTTQIQVSQLLKMGRGAVLELERRVGDPVDILVNKRKVAVGEIIVVEDRLGITLTETLKADKLE